MKKLLRVVTATLITSLVSTNMATAQYTEEDYNTRDLGYFGAWFEGHFDNDEQTYFQADRRWELNPELRHRRLHTIHRRVDLPFLGDMVFYVEEYMDSDTRNITDQHLAVITSNPAEHTWTQDNYSFEDPKDAEGAHMDPSILEDINANDVSLIEGCSIIWRRNTGQFEGTIPGNTCKKRVNGRDGRVELNVALYEDRYWRTKRVLESGTGDLLEGHVTADPYEMSKVTEYYSCTMRFMEGFYNKAGARADNYLEGEDQRAGPFVVPSQGGEFFAKREKDGLTYSGRIRSRQYPYYELGSDFTVLQARKYEESGDVNQFSWAVVKPGAPMIVLALGWLTYQCNLEPAPF